MRPVVILAVAALIVGLTPRRWRLPLWVAAIAFAVVPWDRLLDHAHWERVQWVPFVPPPDLRGRDLLINVLMYLPFGWFLTRWRMPPVAVLTVAWWGMCLSIATEWSQVYSHGRFPTATDVVMNTAGAALGALLARRLVRRRGT